MKRLFADNHIPQKDIEPLVGSVRNLFKASKDEDAFKRREFTKKIDMFEQNAGDKPLFPPKLAEEMYKTNKYSNRTADVTTTHNQHNLKEKDQSHLAGKHMSSKDKDAFKRREFTKKIDMFEQNAGDKPLFPPKLAEEMYKIKKDLKAKDSINPDSNQLPNTNRFIKPNNDKGKSK